MFVDVVKVYFKFLIAMVLLSLCAADYINCSNLIHVTFEISMIIF